MDNIDKLSDRLIDITNKLEAAIGAKGPALVDTYVTAVWFDALVGVLGGVAAGVVAYGLSRVIRLGLAAHQKDWSGSGDLVVVFGTIGAVVAGIVSLGMIFSNLSALLYPSGYALMKLIG